MRDHPYYVNGPMPEEPIIVTRNVTLEVDIADLESADDGEIHLVTTEPKDEDATD